MEVQRINKSRRSGQDRRLKAAVIAGSERRSGIERRNLDEKLRHMVQQSQKEKVVQEQPRIRSGNGNVIRRRNGQREKRISP